MTKSGRKFFRSSVIGILVFLVYFLGAKIGLSLAFKHGSVSPVWPPTGIALSALLILGIEYWPAIFVGALVSNVFLTPVGFFPSSVIAMGNTLEAVAGAYLLNRAIPDGLILEKIKNYVLFLLLGCVVAPIASATIGVVTLCLGKSAAWSQFPTLWFTWWIGDGSGALVFVPWFLSLREARDLWPERGKTKKFALFFGCLTAIGVVASVTSMGPALPLAYLYILVLVLAATELSQFAVSSLSIVVYVMVISGTLRGRGQFLFSDPNLSLLIVQSFVFACSLAAQWMLLQINDRRKHIQHLTESEARLSESEGRFRQLADNIREIFYVSDLDSQRLLYVSPASKSIWGLRPDTFSSVIERIHPEDREIVTDALEKIRRGEETSIEYRVILPDGNVNWIWDRSVPIKDQGPRRIAGIAEDITLRKEVDEELRKKAEDLSKANRDLEHFAYVASHDLKAPLRTVSSFVKLLQKKYSGRFDAEADEFMDLATKGCVRMDRLIEDLLKDARVGHQELRVSNVDLGEVVRLVLADLKSLISESKTTVNVEWLPIVKGDQTQLREVFQNLINNAIKYRREDPQIKVSSARKEGEWIIKVSDNGIGISQKGKERIFSPFVRLHSGSSYEGSGIGLATCKKVVEKRGGKIWVGSTERVGSDFYFSIPDELPSSERARERGKAPEAYGNYERSFRNSRDESILEILMVEDSPADSNIIEILLKKQQLPFRIHIVKDGEQALAFLKRIGFYSTAPRPSLVLLDLNLPKMDGTAVLKEIKKDPSLRQLPVIVISSSIREEDIRSSYDLNASAYIQKPRDLNGYREMLMQLRKFWFEQVSYPKNSNPPRPTSPDSVAR